MEFSVDVPVKLTEKQMAYILCGAFEGYSSSWIEDISYIDPLPESAPKWAHEWPRYCTIPMFGRMKITMIEGDGEVIIDAQCLQYALDAMSIQFPLRLHSLFDESYDAEDADIFLQLACFSEVIYG